MARSLFVVFLLLLGACGREPEPVRQQFFVFGTLVDISIAQVPPAQAEAAMGEVAREFQRFHREWHAWQPGPLAEINRAFAEGREAGVEQAELLDLIRRSQELFRLGDGLFNPAIGKLIALWGFHADELPQGPPPTDTDIAALVAQQPRMDDIIITGDRVRSRNPAVHLDFGAAAKGYAVDLAIASLRRLGIENTIVNAGGNLRAVGRHSERPWRIGIRHPSGTGVLASLEIDGDESVFTSGNYERYREYQGKRYSHIIDPRSGRPVDGTVSVTVVHAGGTVADAAATALSVAGLEGWRRIARQLGVTQVMLVDAAGKVYLTPELAPRIRFEVEPLPQVEVVGWE